MQEGARRTNGGAGCDCVGGVSGNTNTPDGKQGGLGALGPPSVAGGTASTDVLGQFRGLTWMPGAVGGTGSWGLPGGGGGGGGAGGFASVEIPTHHNDYEGMPGGGGVRADAAVWAEPAVPREVPRSRSYFAPQSLPTPVQTLLFRVQAALADTAAPGEAAPRAAGAAPA